MLDCLIREWDTPCKKSARISLVTLFIVAFAFLAPSNVTGAEWRGRGNERKKYGRKRIDERYRTPPLTKHYFLAVVGPECDSA